MLSGKNILVGVTGGIAAYKSATLVRLLVKKGAHVRVIMTPSSHQFITPLTLSTLSKNPVYTEFSKDSTGEWNNHVELALWADLFIIAPATANTIAKMANGVCDNLLLATYFSSKNQVVVAPAMDLDMYLHSATQTNINRLKEFGNQIIAPVNGELASGLVGEGRMEEPENIFNWIVEYFLTDKALSKKKILITAGATREQIDPVRFISNKSTGTMGIELAERAIKLGAEVVLVIGPTSLKTSKEIRRIDVVSAEEMYLAVHQNISDADIVIMSAAVSDYTPTETNSSKIKKKNTPLEIKLSPTKDILKSVGEIKTKKQILVGFALETDDEVKNAKSKLKRKNLDLIVLNSLNDSGAGFGEGTNKITIIDKDNKVFEYELKPKPEVAIDIFNKILSLL
ncbi:MAG: bifunctional phosphopantothenoylcysteine decarboxylase/phosphopantothenate--cysteine ligase CoaBC [Vicingus serpentipes]|nr:bifunctional phosphopantothenoylcysteine decarboxylase/phosphopantothenate--cysteine ligase CoaBC [Vicingus serpentipes]